MSASPTAAEGVPWHSRTVQVVLASTALAPLAIGALLLAGVAALAVGIESQVDWSEVEF